jgi:hypothetical protein
MNYSSFSEMDDQLFLMAAHIQPFELPLVGPDPEDLRIFLGLPDSIKLVYDYSDVDAACREMEQEK